MTTRLRMGVIGCGEISQIVHLPTLRELPALFEVTALVDPSAHVIAALKSEWPHAACSTNDQALLSRNDVDAVLITNHHVDHADTAKRALVAGKHVLLEKPMCINLWEADTLQQAEEASGLVVQIGYMRRYAPAFDAAKDILLRRPHDILRARVHDLIGRNNLIVDSTAHVIRRTDVQKELRQRGQVNMARALTAAIGESEGLRAQAYQLLLGLGCHDLSAMRELLGRPNAVSHMSARRGQLAATFDYGDYACQCVIGVDSIPRYDTFLEVATDDQVVRVDFDTPYIRNLPASLSVRQADGVAGVIDTTRFISRRDSFKVMWEEFHANVMHGRQPKTSVADSREDLILFQEMLEVMV